MDKQVLVTLEHWEGTETKDIEEIEREVSLDCKDLTDWDFLRT